MSSSKNGKNTYRESLIPHQNHKSKFDPNYILEEDNNNSLDALDSR